ncbi:hypothetical protein N1031_06810 [Herbiconiux moechotypicola]|uniref:Uncharacterized protein n=1 Tax=Herbiconiux moechotypicola TaxID=637393 RepID=A0ABN3DFU1_9MICO|nr:hypothetical protein [Herbiconiux moechotypicola]MCS5729468.1 hypothetical protein [Herbiconiux moechotypicola]
MTLLARLKSLFSPASRTHRGRAFVPVDPPADFEIEYRQGATLVIDHVREVAYPFPRSREDLAEAAVAKLLDGTAPTLYGFPTEESERRFGSLQDQTS